MGIGVELRLKKADSANLIAVFERKGRLILWQDGPLIWSGNKKFNAAHGPSGRKYSPMLVRDVELVQLPERMSLASTVRLHMSDDRFDLGGNPLEECGSPLIVGQTRLILAYWEIGFSQHLVASSRTEFNDKFRCETVESASQIVDDVTDM